MDNIPYGYCKCGCGNLAPLATRTNTSHGIVKGDQQRFIVGHNNQKYRQSSLVEEYRKRWSKDSQVPYGCCWCGCGQPTWIATRNMHERGLVKGEPARYIGGHQKGGLKGYTVEDREYDTPCWIMTGYTTSRGYSRVSRDGRLMRAHRYYYEQKYGTIPEGLEPDHLCNITSCVNPDHIEPVTHAENVRRGNSAKMSAERVRALRSSVDSGEISISQAATYFSISYHTAWDICTRRRWKDID